MSFSIAMSDGFLAQQAFVLLAVFTRLGAMVMTFPALGAESVPARIRLVIALALTAIVVPLVEAGYPDLPGTAFGIGAFVFAEALVGLIVGSLVRLVMSGVQTAGSIIAFQTGLAFAQKL